MDTQFEESYPPAIEPPSEINGEWVECWKCGGEGFDDHDCGEDVCCCLYPEDNVTCDICMGMGGWYARPEEAV